MKKYIINVKNTFTDKYDIEEIAELNIELKILFKAMKQLSNDELKLISLIYFEDKTERECAEIYNISQKNIKKADFVQTQQTHKKL